MRLLNRLGALVAFAAAAATVASAEQPVLFHGTSVVILPSNGTSSPSKSTLKAANFYCYMTDQGYFSFGWWVNPSPAANTSHCTPDSPNYHWYEFATLQGCDSGAGTCEFSTQNIAVRAPRGEDGNNDGYDDDDHKDGDEDSERRDPDAGPLPVPFPHDRKLRYVIRPVDVGNGAHGQMAVSWVDDGEVQVYGVGTREVLSGVGGEGKGGEEGLAACRKAMGTLRGVFEKYRPRLAMEVDWALCDEGVKGGKGRLFRQGGDGGRYRGGDL
ncbi:uncharacterized protein B0H64DRAFT_453125 [Chaetomium fimeti]|uniref:Ecp2 effector protein domain-containing protein n=1 Tax=Chaetomium fimeti TaxID=1854472 RepID=A0AAE0H546_9PEZI|nr:hypothetical protein B0H64DRAFT_453125 [Chaetomium fimeti]